MSTYDTLPPPPAVYPEPEPSTSKAYVEALEKALAASTEELKFLREGIKNVQGRCSELLEETRTLRRGVLRAQVVEFHEIMGQPVYDAPKVPDADRVRLRLRLIAEEFFEVVESCLLLGTNNLRAARCHIDAVIDYANVCVNLPALADGLADLDYVVEGTRLECGIDGAPIARLVHENNLLKVSGEVRPDGKRLKPPGFVGPDIAGELRRQGWRG